MSSLEDHAAGLCKCAAHVHEYDYRDSRCVVSGLYPPSCQECLACECIDTCKCGFQRRLPAPDDRLRAAARAAVEWMMCREDDGYCWMCGTYGTTEDPHDYGCWVGHMSAALATPQPAEEEGPDVDCDCTPGFPHKRKAGPVEPAPDADGLGCNPECVWKSSHLYACGARIANLEAQLSMASDARLRAAARAVVDAFNADGHFVMYDGHEADRQFLTLRMLRAALEEPTR